jgi:hypothetical protein
LVLIILSTGAIFLPNIFLPESFSPPPFAPLRSAGFQPADLRKQGICGSKGPQGRSAFLARSQSQISNLQTFGTQREVRNVSVDSSFGCGSVALRLCAFALKKSIRQPAS